MLQKALWIAEQLDENADDVYDVLKGNITRPNELVSSVTALANQYDMEYNSKIVKK